MSSNHTVCQATHVLHTVNYERTDLFIETSMPILFLPGQPKPIFNKVFSSSFLINFVFACDSSFVVSFHFFFSEYSCASLLELWSINYQRLVFFFVVI